MDDRRQRFEAEAVVHLKSVYNAAWHFVRREDEARDLTQETMLRAYRTFDRFTPGTNARAWLLTILYSVFVNRFHKARRTPEVSLDELESQGQQWAAPTAEGPDPWLGEWTEPEVAEAMDQLPDVFRTAVWLVDVEDLTYEEAASVMGCAVGTVRSRLARARRALATTLREYARSRGLLAGKGGSR